MLRPEDEGELRGWRTEDLEERVRQLLPQYLSLGRPIGAWNCKHMTWPIILGVSECTYSKEELAEMNRLSTEEIEIDGRKKTRYEWSQEQRRIETAVRYQKDRANLARHSGHDDIRRDAQAKINKLTKAYEGISEKAKLGAEWDRMRVAGFRSVKVEPLTTKAGNGKRKTARGNVGAAGTNRPNVKDIYTGKAVRYVPKKPVTYPSDHTMAGYNCKTGRQIDDVDRLVKVYNTPDAEKWQKEKARYWVFDADDDERQVEVHWYQHPDVGKVEFKIKTNEGSMYVDEW